MIRKVASASSEARITHLNHASVFTHSVSAINYTARVSEIRESLHPHFIAFNNTTELWAGKKINETFAIKMASFLTNFLVRFHAPRGQTPYAQRSESYPAHYIIISFFLCWLYLAGRLACLTRRGPQTPPSHMHSFLQTSFVFVPWSRRTWRCWHQAALPRNTNTGAIYYAYRLFLANVCPCCIGRRLVSKSGHPPSIGIRALIGGLVKEMFSERTRCIQHPKQIGFEYFLYVSCIEAFSMSPGALTKHL